MFDFLPDDKRKGVLDYLARNSGTPDDLTRPPEQMDMPPLAAPAPAAPPDASPAQPAAPADDTMARFKAAQGQDMGTRQAVARTEWMRGLFGNPMDARKLNVNAAGDVADEVGLGQKIAQGGREAALFQPKLRSATAQAATEEAGVPYAGDIAKNRAVEAGARAAKEQQQATTGAADLQDKEAFRDALRNNDSTATSTVRALAGKLFPGQADKLANATGAELFPLLGVLEKTYGIDATAAWHKEMARARIATGGGEGLVLSPEALDQAAQTYLTTGQLPQLGMGRAGGAMKAKIANRAAELDPTADLAGNRAGFGANKASLQKLQTQSDAVNAFERTAMANLDQFLEVSKGIVDTGSPFFNMGGRRFAEKFAGDPNMARWNVARQVAVQEIGKVLSGAMGSAAVSDSARHEVEQLLSPDASLAQITAAANILRKDMQNRKAAFAAEIADVRTRTGGKKKSSEPEKPAAADPLGIR